MASYRVTYFATKGGGELIRLALVVAGQEFEDERLDKETWLTRKSDAPAKQLPLLTITENGKDSVYCQSKACAKYIAKKNGFYGSNPEEELLIDEAFDCLTDAIQVFIRTFLEQDATKKAELQKKKVEETLPRLNDYIILRSSQYGQNGYIIGPKMTLVDLELYNLVDQTSQSGETSFEQFPELQKHAQLVKENKKIAAWIEKTSAST